VIVPAGGEINEKEVIRIEALAIESVRIRTALTCKTKRGICVKCYGRDLARGAIVNMGEASVRSQLSRSVSPALS